MIKKNPDLFFAIFLLVMLVIFKYLVLGLPYYWDGLNFLASTIDYLQNNFITPELLEYNLGHPIFLPFFIFILFKIFGTSTLVANSVILFSAFLTLYFTYLIGKTLFSRKIGIITSLILFFTPIFFSYSATLFLDMPLAALTVMALYFAIRSNLLMYFIFSSLAILTKENGILVVVGVTLAKLIKEKKINKNVILYALPVIVFLGWLLTNKIYYGEFLYPTTTSLIKINPIKILFNFFLVLKILFFDQFRWILTSLFILSFVNLKKLKNIKINKIIYSLITSIIAFIALYNFDLLTRFFISYYPNVHNYLILVKQFSPLFSVLLFSTLLFYKNIIKELKIKKYLEVIITLLIMLISFSLVIPLSPRYLLPLFPLIFLFYSFSISKMFKKYSYLIVLVIIIIFSLGFTGERSTVGFTLETNMEYVDAIKTHQLAASYIEDNFPDATVLAAFPQSSELKYPYGGYVKKPINIVTYSPIPGVVEKNFTQFLYPETIPEFSVNISEIDLYYYSGQEFATKPILETAKELNLTLIKRFEINNKLTEIYMVNK